MKALDGLRGDGQESRSSRGVRAAGGTGAQVSKGNVAPSLRVCMCNGADEYTGCKGLTVLGGATWKGRTILTY